MNTQGNTVELFSLISFLATVGVGTAVGLRLLLLARRTRKLPEIALGTACLTTAIGGVFLCPVIYFADSWSVGTFTANALGLVGAGSLHLAFLPAAAWRRWVEKRAAA